MCPKKYWNSTFLTGSCQISFLKIEPKFDFFLFLVVTNQMWQQIFGTGFNFYTFFTIFHHFSWLMRSPKTPWRISFELLEYQKSIRQSEKLSRNWPILIPVNPVRVYRSTPYPKRSLKRIFKFLEKFYGAQIFFWLVYFEVKENISG